MGYNTDFTGAFNVTPTLKPEHIAYLAKFCETRRMYRDQDLASQLPDPVRKAAGLPVGTDGAYFVGGDGYCGQTADASVVLYNHPPREQPGLWCQWKPSEDGALIRWDGGEKFYSYIAWLKYLVKHFLQPWGYTLNGRVKWRGEDEGGTGVVVARDNDIWTE
jgi:hypothetical protein